MQSWFERTPKGETQVTSDELGAYKAGRADERGSIRQDSSHVDRAVNDGYDRGQREEKLRHPGSPLLGLLTIVLLFMALVMIVLVVKTGSFTNAGAVLDHIIQPPVHAAAEQAGSALENAGKSIRSDPAPAHP